MDDALRSLHRRLLAAGGDPALAREYRRALERQGDLTGFDALEGALCVRAATGDEADPALDPPPRWERVAVGGRPPALAPRGPDAGPLAVRWRADGRARWASASVVVLEHLDRSLEGRCARAGRLLWTVPAAGPARAAADLDTERTTVLGWAAAPWGAVVVSARHEARLARPRRGSASWRPRATEREVLERGPARVEVTLQVALAPGGRWGAAAPHALVERAQAGEALCDTDLALEGWDDDLLALALDAEAPRFAVRWRDAEEDWAVFEAGEAEGGAWLGAAGWTAAADEDPVGRADALRPRTARVDLARRLVEAPGAGPLELPPGAADPAGLALDEGLLLRARDPDGVERLWTSRGGPLAPLVLPADVQALVDELELRLWDEAPVESGPRRAVVLVAGDHVLLQAGDVLVALGRG